eukprot:Rmarinus@m.6975
MFKHNSVAPDCGWCRGEVVRKKCKIKGWCDKTCRIKYYGRCGSCLELQRANRMCVKEAKNKELINKYKLFPCGDLQSQGFCYVNVYRENLRIDGSLLDGSVRNVVDMHTKAIVQFAKAFESCSEYTEVIQEDRGGVARIIHLPLRRGNETDRNPFRHGSNHYVVHGPLGPNLQAAVDFFVDTVGSHFGLYKHPATISIIVTPPRSPAQEYHIDCWAVFTAFLLVLNGKHPVTQMAKLPRPWASPDDASKSGDGQWGENFPNFYKKCKQPWRRNVPEAVTAPKRTCGKGAGILFSTARLHRGPANKHGKDSRYALFLSWPASLSAYRNAISQKKDDVVVYDSHIRAYVNS